MLHLQEEKVKERDADKEATLQSDLHGRNRKSYKVWRKSSARRGAFHDRKKRSKGRRGM
jgi:hypothetical protein